MAKKKYLDEIGLKQVVDLIEGQIGEIYTEIDNMSSGQIECDTELSADSERPVQNKVIKEAFDGIISGTTPVGNANKLNGLTAEEVGASGVRNLIPYPHYHTTRTTNGITFTDNGDGTVTANGTATASASYYPASNWTLKAGTYTFSGGVDGGAWATYHIRIDNGNTSLCTLYDSNGKTFTLSEDTSIRMIISVGSGVTLNNAVFKPMLELGSVAHDYVPYHLGGAKDADTVDGYHASEWFLHPVAETAKYSTIASLPNGDWALFDAKNRHTDYPTSLANEGLVYGVVRISTTTSNNGYKVGTIIAVNAGNTKLRVLDFFTNDNKTIVPVEHLPLTGGTLSGDLYIKKSAYPSEVRVINYNGEAFFRNYVDDNNYKEVSLAADGSLIHRVKTNGTTKTSTVLDTGNMADHVLTKSGGTLSGAVRVDQNQRVISSFFSYGNAAYIRAINKDDSTSYSEFTLASDAIRYKVFNNNSVVKNAEILHTGNAHDYTVELIAGTQTAATGAWTGVTKSASLYHGKQILYQLPYAGSGNATLNLTLSGGGTTGAIACYYTGATRLTTHYGAGSTIRLVYLVDHNVNGTKYTGWWADANYDSNNKVAISANAPTATTNYYPTMHTSTSGTTAVTANAYTKFQHLTGTADTAGFNQLTLGNATASGTAGNSTGKIALYGTTTYYTILQPGAPTANRTITLPNASGTVVTTGNLTLPASTAYTTNQARNTVFTTTDPGAGASTTYANGSIICVYE